MQAPSDIQLGFKRSSLYRGDRGPWIEHLMEDEGMTYPEAMLALEPWECIPYIDAKRGHMATMIKLNREVHFAIYRKYRNTGQVTSRRIAEFLKPVLDKNVFLVTKVAAGEDHRFIERLGFEELGVTMDGMIRTYILNEIKMPRTKQ